MSAKWVRKTYRVPAKRGMYVEIYGRHGVMVYEGRISSFSNYIHVDGMPFHPTDGVVYYNEYGSVLLDTREKGR